MSSTRDATERLVRAAGPTAFALAAFVVGAGVALVGERAALLVAVAVGGVLMINFTRQATIVAFALLPLASLEAPGIGIPLGELAIVALLVASTISGRRPERRAPTWFVLSLTTLVAVFAFSAALNDGLTGDALRRLGHIGIFAALIVALSVGLLDRDAALRGILVGLGLAIASAATAPLTGLERGRYDGRLVGLFHDPNVAGFYLAVLGPLAVGMLRRQRWRVVGLMVIGGAVLATQSRTAIAAFLIGGIWVLGRRTFSLSTSIACFVVALGLLSLVPSDAVRAGVFNDRAGTDTLRAEVTEQSLDSISSGLLVGHGPGTATVLVYDRYNFRFHNSYLAMVQEGGLVALVAFCLPFFGAIAVLLRTRRRSIALEFGFIAVLVISVSLGEVLLEFPTAIVIGLAMSMPSDPVAARAAGSAAAPPRALGPPPPPRRAATRAVGRDDLTRRPAT